MPKDTAKKDWSVTTENQLPFDPLLGCLVALTKYYGRPLTSSTLIAGLPLEENLLTPALFERAARRARLSAKTNRVPLETIQGELLPAVLLLHNKKACLLLGRTDNNKLTIIQPESGEGETNIDLEALNQSYSGYAIFVRPKYRFDTRTQEPGAPRVKQWFWGVIGQAWPLYGEVIVASLLINTFAIAVPLFVMNVYDRVVPNSAFETLWVLAIGIGVVIIFEFIMRTLRGHFVDYAAQQVDVQLSGTIFEQILNINMTSRPQSVGVMANTVHSFEAFRDFITSATISVLVDIPFVLIFLLVISFIGGPLVMVPAIAIPLVLLTGLLLQLPLTKMVRASYRHSSEKQAVLIETLSRVETVKSLCLESMMQSRWEGIVNQAAKLGIRLRTIVNFGINFAIFIQHSSTIAVVVAGVYIIARGDLTVGGLIACTILTNRAVAPVAQIAGVINRYKQSKTSLDALDVIMKAPIERPYDKHFLHRPEVTGQIEFKNVCFHYPNQSLMALNDISFKLNPGDRVGIIGRMGSGKTTLEKLLLKLYQPNSGSILLDDTELSQLDPAQIRHQIGYVPQEIDLFHGSIRDNIIITAPFIEDEALIRAADISGVSDFVKGDPEGFDRQVGERGERLSGGQRQSIAIARALLLNPPILLFDEPCNFMDDTATKQFIKRLHNHLAHKTLILITHKPAILALTNRLIVLDSGQLIADGPKDKVIEKLSAGQFNVKSPKATKK